MRAVDVVRARIKPGLKREATAVLASMGLSVSDAIRLMLTRVASEKALPFELRIPNADTREAIQEIRDGKGQRFNSVADLMADLND